MEPSSSPTSPHKRKFESDPVSQQKSEDELKLEHAERDNPEGSLTTSKPGQALQVQRLTVDQIKTQASLSNAVMKTSITECLAHLDEISLESIDKLKDTLFENCDVVRRSGYVNGKGEVFSNKEAERQFCNFASREILQQTKAIAAEIVTDGLLTAAQKAQKMENLKNLAAGLRQLVSVQKRFGGSLAWCAFHNIFHSSAVGIESAKYYAGEPNRQYAAFNAGAAHDSVMRYLKPGPLAIMNEAGKGIRTKFVEQYNERFQLLNAKKQLKSSTNESDRKQLEDIDKKLEKVEGDWWGQVKVCYMNGEQKRNAGTEKGQSEGDSIVQYRKYSQKIDDICLSGIADASLREQFQSLSRVDDAFGKDLIETTVPSRANFFFPLGGHKCYTMSNYPLIPDPFGLAKLRDTHPSVVARLTTILDAAMDEAIAKTQAKPVFSKDVKNPPDKGTYSYADGIVDVKNFQNAPLSDKGKFVLLPFLRPREMEDHFFSKEMPPFNDPIAPFIEIVSNGNGSALLEAYDQALLEKLEADRKAGDEVIDFLHSREKLLGTPSADLGQYARIEGNPWWCIYATFSLMQEEQPAITAKFCKVDAKIKGMEIQGKQYANGLEDSSLHALLDEHYAIFLENRKAQLADAESVFEKSTGLILDEYMDIQLFIAVASHYIRDQIPFGKGRVTYEEFRTNAPLSALSKVKFEGAKIVEKHLEAYRKSNCENNRLRLKGVEGAIAFERECREKGPGFLVKQFYGSMALLAGKAFKLDPTDFLLTDKDGKVKQEYLDDQNNQDIEEE